MSCVISVLLPVGSEYCETTNLPPHWVIHHLLPSATWFLLLPRIVWTKRLIQSVTATPHIITLETWPVFLGGAQKTCLLPLAPTWFLDSTKRKPCLLASVVLPPVHLLPLLREWLTNFKGESKEGGFLLATNRTTPPHPLWLFHVAMLLLVHSPTTWPWILQHVTLLHVVFLAATRLFNTTPHFKNSPWLCLSFWYLLWIKPQSCSTQKFHFSCNLLCLCM